MRMCAAWLLSWLVCLLSLASPSLAIFNGQPSSQPWIANVEIKDGVCTGTLISSTRVLTAAHCLRRGGKYVKQARVGFGSDYSSLSWQTVTDIRPLKSFRPSPGGWRDDLAVLALPQPEAIPPVPLSSGVQSNRNRVGEIYGWGVTQSWTYPDKPMQSQAPVLSLPRCRRDVARERGTTSRTASWFCVGEKGSPQKVKTACLGDSGGPLLMNGRQVGVLSFYISDSRQTDGAKDCASSYMYYLRLNNRLLSWISKQL